MDCETVALRDILTVRDIPEGFVSCIECGISCSACIGMPFKLGGKTIIGRLPVPEGKSWYDYADENSGGYHG